MPPKLRPTEYGIADCSGACTLNRRRNPVADALHDGYCAGMNDAEIVALSDKLGHHVSLGASARHRARHLVKRDVIGAVLMGEPEDGKVDHVKVLEMMIARASRTAHLWKLGPSDTLKAIEMHYRLTEGRSDNALMEALSEAAAAGVDEPVEVPEDVDAG